LGVFYLHVGWCRSWCNILSFTLHTCNQIICIYRNCHFIKITWICHQLN